MTAPKNNVSDIQQCCKLLTNSASILSSLKKQITKTYIVKRAGFIMLLPFD